MNTRLKNGLILAAGLLIGGGLGVLLLFAFVLVRQPGQPANQGIREGVALPAPVVGSPAPDFDFVQLDGTRASLKDFQGQPVLINFWATWCAPCELEMPAFQSRYESSQGSFTILAVNYAEPEERIQPYVDRLGLTFPIVLDPESKVQRMYNVRGYPTSLLVDAEGVIRVYHIGLMSENQLDKYLKDLGVGG
jgi:cytochrome c biogenesis protein CcmG, thiol:disulfide interchange protein DsbE